MNNDIIVKVNVWGWKEDAILLSPDDVKGMNLINAGNGENYGLQYQYYVDSWKDGHKWYVVPVLNWRVKEFGRTYLREIGVQGIYSVDTIWTVGDDPDLYDEPCYLGYQKLYKRDGSLIKADPRWVSCKRGYDGWIEEGKAKLIA